MTHTRLEYTDEEILDRLRTGRSVAQIAQDLLEPRQRVFALSAQLRRERHQPAGHQSPGTDNPPAPDTPELTALLTQAEQSTSRRARHLGRRISTLLAELTAVLTAAAEADREVIERTRARAAARQKLADAQAALRAARVELNATRAEPTMNRRLRSPVNTWARANGWSITPGTPSPELVRAYRAATAGAPSPAEVAR